MGEIFRKRLDRDVPAQLRIVSTKDDTHAACTQRGCDRVWADFRADCERHQSGAIVLG